VIRDPSKTHLKHCITNAYALYSGVYEKYPCRIPASPLRSCNIMFIKRSLYVCEGVVPIFGPTPFLSLSYFMRETGLQIVTIV
jgi:hypothetical protein